MVTVLLNSSANTIMLFDEIMIANTRKADKIFSVNLSWHPPSSYNF